MTTHIINPQNITGMLNRKMSTPLGDGIVFGHFQLKDAGVEGIATRVLVRLPVNDVTREHLRDSNCVTPRAEKNGLWVFPVSEVG